MSIYLKIDLLMGLIHKFIFGDIFYVNCNILINVKYYPRHNLYKYKLYIKTKYIYLKIIILK